MTDPDKVRGGPGQKKSRLKITNAQNDARYVALGRTLVLADDPDRDGELARANKKKNGHPYVYPESLFLSLATIRSFCGMSFRVLEGFAAASVGEGHAPGYRQIHRRINDIEVSVGDNVVTARGGRGVLNLAIDGTGLSPNARSEYIRYRHKVKHGFIRLVLVVDTDTREILAFSVTDDTVGEAPQFEPLTCTALRNAGGASVPGVPADGQEPPPPPAPPPTADDCPAPTPAVRGQEPMPPAPPPAPPSTDRAAPDQPQEVVMRADGGFDSRRIFEICRQLGITPYIRINHNAVTRSRGVSRARTMAAIDQLGGGVADPGEFARLTRDEREANRKEWKRRVKYGRRWLSEIVISSFKRLFSDSVAARKWENVVQEINLKVNIYNRMLQVQREAIAMA